MHNVCGEKMKENEVNGLCQWSHATFSWWTRLVEASPHESRRRRRILRENTEDTWGDFDVSIERSRFSGTACWLLYTAPVVPPTFTKTPEEDVHLTFRFWSQLSFSVESSTRKPQSVGVDPRCVVDLYNEDFTSAKAKRKYLTDLHWRRRED